MAGSGIPIVSDLAGAAGDLLFGKDAPLTAAAPVPAETPMPALPTDLEKRKRAAANKAKRRGRASTVMTANEEPLGGL